MIKQTEIWLHSTNQTAWCTQTKTLVPEAAETNLRFETLACVVIEKLINTS